MPARQVRKRWNVQPQRKPRCRHIGKTQATLAHAILRSANAASRSQNLACFFLPRACCPAHAQRASEPNSPLPEQLPAKPNRPAHHACVAGDIALGRGAGAVGVAGALHTAAWLAVCGRSRADTGGGGGVHARCAGGASSGCLALVLVAHGAGAALRVVQACLHSKSASAEMRGRRCSCAVVKRAAWLTHHSVMPLLGAFSDVPTAQDCLACSEGQHSKVSSP
jgi:hypothetical protein